MAGTGTQDRPCLRSGYGRGCGRDRRSGRCAVRSGDRHGTGSRSATAPRLGHGDANPERCTGAVGRSVAQLARSVPTPAVALAGGGHATGVRLPGSQARPDVIPRDRVRFRKRSAPPVVIAELAAAVVAPAVRLAGCRDSARVVCASRQCIPDEVAADGHWAHLVGTAHLVTAAVGIPVPELSGPVTAPAQGSTLGGDPARVCRAGRDGRPTVSTRNGNR